MLQALGIEGVTNDSGLKITTGSEVEPREVKFEDLTEDDYSDYVLVKAVQLERNNGVWAVSGDKRARLWNLFQIKGLSVPSNVEGKFFDVEAIYSTNKLNNQVINELEFLKSPIEVSDPEGGSGIEVIGTETTSADATYFNLQGQRVSPNTKGILIRNGRKVVNK